MKNINELTSDILKETAAAAISSVKTNVSIESITQTLNITYQLKSGLI